MNKLYAVGLGPGEEKYMTAQAREILEQCDVLCGYTVYLDLIRPLYPNKVFLSTPMKQEIGRCHMALEQAQIGKTVAMVCSGDTGVYGMAGLLYQLGQEYPQVEIEVVPGITAAISGAALLGAPLIHDFAVISLSDLLTPWESICKRVEMAASADFVLCIYNPSSQKRHDYLQKACDLVLQHRDPKTVCAYVKNIGRAGESATLLTLEQLREEQNVDMFTTVYIGNSQTMRIGDKMVTPRGYEKRMGEGQ